MKNTTWNVVGYTILLALGPGRSRCAQAAQTTEPHPRLTVRLYNLAKVPDGYTHEAMETTAVIFKRIAVNLTWLDCVPSDSGRTAAPACHQYPSATQIILRVAEQSKNPEVFECGIGIPASEGQISKHAIVFYRCVEELAVDHDSTRVALLGHMIAHEIGHLLLGKGSHTSEGIMHYPWGKREIELAEQGWLGFTVKQGDRIRREVRKRIRAPEEESKD